MEQFNRDVQQLADMQPASTEEVKEVKEVKGLEAKEIFDRIAKTVVDMFGEPYVSINYEDYSATIHFPELIVKNSIGIEHPIYDMYVKLTFSIRTDRGDRKDNRIALYDIQGVRSSFTIEEYLAGYNFSHLGSSCEGSGGFCLGWGTPISEAKNYLSPYESSNTEFIYLEEITEETVNNFIEGLERFLFMLQPYLEWESITGGPYKLLSSLGNNRFGGNNQYIINSNHVNIAKEITRIIITNPEHREELFNFCIVNAGDGLKINIFQLTNLIDNLFNDEKKTLSDVFVEYDVISFEYINRSNNSLAGRVDPDTKEILGGYRFIFKGEPVKQVIRDFTPTKIEDLSLIIHPGIVGMVSHMLMKIFSKIKSKL